MAVAKVLLSLALLGAVEAGSPCGTVAPFAPVVVAAPASPCTTVTAAPVVTAAPASPCTTVTTTLPAVTCASYACPAGFSPKGGVIMCGNAHDEKCCSHRCCNIVTTVTTTPPPTTTPKAPCSTVTTTPGTTVTTTPGTTVTTTPPPTTTPKGPCSTVTTTPGTTVTTTPGTTVTTTPGTTVTTTPPPPTCASFTCAAGSDAKNPALVCANRECTQHQCCLKNPCATVNLPPVPVKVVAPPASPCGTVAPAVVAPPSSPCATVAPARKYDAKMSALTQDAAASKKEPSAVTAWAFPFFGVVAMFSFAAFVGVRARRGQRSTRQLRVVEPMVNDETDAEMLLGHDTVLE